ncbi:MAG: hypothetical protein ACFCBW_01485 [Candidatus Competibacterales bacterium]
MEPSELPLPAHVHKQPFDGGFEVELDRKSLAVLEAMRGEYKTAQMDIYTVESEAQWPSLVDHYAKVLEAKGYKRRDDIIPPPEDSQQAVWYDHGWFNRQAVAVTLLSIPEDPSAPPLRFLVVVTGG